MTMVSREVKIYGALMSAIDNRKWYSPKALADQANNSFLSVARLAGSAARMIEQGSVKSLLVISEPLRRRRTEGSPLESADATPAIDERSVSESSETTSCAQAPPPTTAAPPVDAGTSRRPPERPRTSVTEPESPAVERARADEGPTIEPVDIEGLVARYPVGDRVENLRMRVLMDEFMYGTDAARLDAQQGLVEMGDRAEPFLVACLQGASPALAKLALGGLARIGFERTAECISELMSSADDDVRLVALWAAQQLTDEEARPFFVAVVRDPSPEVRLRAVSYLSWRDSEWAVPVLRGLCHDPEATVSWPALEALAALRPEEATELMERVWSPEGPEDRTHRRRVAAVLERQRGRAEVKSMAGSRGKSASRSTARKTSRASGSASRAKLKKRRLSRTTGKTAERGDEGKPKQES